MVSLRVVESHILGVFLAIFAVACIPGGFASATNPTKSVAQADKAKGGKPKKRVPTGPKVDPEQERVAIALVDAHLPELKKLIERLRTDDPRQYDLAIRDLAKSARRLQTAKNRDETLFEIELQLLQAQTGVNILAAKLKVRDNESDRKSLRKAAAQLHTAEVARAEYNVQYLKERIKKTQQQLTAAEKRLETIRADEKAAIEKKYQSFLKTAGRGSAPQGKPASRPKKP